MAFKKKKILIENVEHNSKMVLVVIDIGGVCLSVLGLLLLLLLVVAVVMIPLLMLLSELLSKLTIERCLQSM